MGYFRKCVADLHPSNQPVSQGKNRVSSRRPRSSGQTNSSAIDRNSTKANKPAFFNDFMQEHSLPGPHVPLIALTGCF